MTSPSTIHHSIVTGEKDFFTSLRRIREYILVGDKENVLSFSYEVNHI